MGRDAAFGCCVSVPNGMFDITWRAFYCSWQPKRLPLAMAQAAPELLTSRFPM